MSGAANLRLLGCRLLVVSVMAAGISDGFAQTSYHARPFDSLETDQFESEASAYRRAEQQVKYLNDFSKYVHDFIKWNSFRLKRMEKERLNIDSMDPAGETYQAWVNWHNNERESYAAWRAQQEAEMIRFRDAITSAQSWWTQHFVDDGVLRGKLDRAIRTAQGWVDYHDNRWTSRELRPAGLVQITPGSPGPDEFGQPALETQPTQSPPESIDVNEWYTYGVWYRNNSARWLKIKSSMRVGLGNPEISPADPYVFWLGPGETTDASWAIRVFDEGRVQVGFEHEILGYSH